jgi:hypothetical protein
MEFSYGIFVLTLSLSGDMGASYHPVSGKCGHLLCRISSRVRKTFDLRRLPMLLRVFPRKISAALSVFAILAICILWPIRVYEQVSGTTLTGTVTDSRVAIMLMAPDVSVVRTYLQH